MAAPVVPTASQPRRRIRDVLPDLHLGFHKPGPKNAITDVEGVLTHTTTIRDKDGAVNTGVTTIVPHKDWFHDACYAGMFSLNGSGEMTGSHWIHETGLLSSPIILTNSFSVGEAYRGIYDYAVKHYKDAEGGVDWFLLPVVAETFDGWMNDLTQFAVRPEHIVEGITNASSDLLPEGNTGGGTGMLCHGHKGGTGTASRVVAAAEGGPKKEYTIGALVQANYGRLRNLRISGAPVGRLLFEELEKAGADEAAKAAAAEADKAKDKKDGSIVIVLATDAPLHPTQLQRIAKRATIGLSRVGSYAHNPSGDLFLAFSTANKIPVQTVTADAREVDPFVARPLTVEVTDDQTINALFEAAADATEEAIYNALCMAETMVGYRGRRIEALDLEKLKTIMAKYM